MAEYGSSQKVVRCCVVPVCRVNKPLMLATLKVYFYTSAISYLQQDDSEEKATITRAFWEAAKSKQFQVYLSDITLEELSRYPEPKRSTLFDFLQEVPYTEVTSSRGVGLDELVLAVNNFPYPLIAEGISEIGVMYRGMRFKNP